MQQVKMNFVYRLFNLLLSFRFQSTKKDVSAFCHIQLQWKVTEHFQNRIKKMGVIEEKSLSEEKYFKQFPVSFGSLKCPL